MYSLLPSDKERQENAAFHKKGTIFRQKALVTSRREKNADGLYSEYCPFADLNKAK